MLSTYTYERPLPHLAYLGAGNMQTVGPVHLNPALVVSVDELVSNRVVRHCLRYVLVAAEHHLDSVTYRGDKPTDRPNTTAAASGEDEAWVANGEGRARDCFKD